MALMWWEQWAWRMTMWQRLLQLQRLRLVLRQKTTVGGRTGIWDAGWQALV